MFALFYHIAKDITTDWNNIFRTVCLKTDKADDALRKAARAIMPCYAAYLQEYIRQICQSPHLLSRQKRHLATHFKPRTVQNIFLYKKPRRAKNFARRGFNFKNQLSQKLIFS